MKGSVYLNLRYEFIRYSIVGLIAFAGDFAVLYLLTNGAGLFYLYSATIRFWSGS